MQRLTSTVLAMLLILALSTQSAFAWDRGAVNTFATLPAGAAHPEGITVDAAGDVYVTTFDVTKASGPGTLLVFSPNGHLRRQVAVAGSSSLLLDLAFHPTTGALLLIDFGSQTVFNVNSATGATIVFGVIPGGAGAGPNVLTFDSQGNVYVTDSFDLRLFNPTYTTGDSEWAAQVSTHTVSRLRARIPPVQGLP